MSTRAKLVLSVATVAAAVGYMALTTLRRGDALQYFKHVDEVVRDPGAWKGRQLQVHGNVVAGSILKRPGSLDYRFALHRDRKWIEVSYTGLTPDSFRDCSELILRGQLVDTGHFRAEEISTKCPSKYDGRRDRGCGEELRAEVQAHRR